MTRLCTLDVTMFCALLVCFVFVAQIAAKVGMDPCVVAQISFLLHRHYMQFYCSICNYTLCLFAHIQAKVGLHSCLVTQIDGFFLQRHYILSIFAYATTPFFICTYPGKSWLRFMFSCTNRWFFAQTLHPVYFCIMVGLFARIQAKVGLDPCLVAQESVLLCRDHIQLYLLLHVPSSFNYGEDRRRFVADPEGKGRGK